MQEYEVADLRQAFKELLGSVVDGVHGVWIADSGRSGPRVGITIMTHGNELSGLAVYRYLRHEYGIQQKIRSGSICFVVNNLEAAGRYLDIAASDNALAKQALRSIDLNMNRLPEDVFSRSDDRRYEITRAND